MAVTDTAAAAFTQRGIPLSVVVDTFGNERLNALVDSFGVGGVAAMAVGVFFLIRARKAKAATNP